MPRLLLSCLAVLGLISSLVFAEAPKSIDVGTKPESVCRGFGGKLYVTMINGEEPGDGTIAKVDGETVTVFAKGFNNPKGMVFVGGFLIASDETVLWKIDKTGTATKLVESKDFPEPVEFLNDVAAGKDGESVYVAEMSSPKPMFDPSGERKLWGLDSEEAKTLPNKGCIYKVTLAGQVSVAIPAGNPALRFPNGVYAAGTKEKERVFAADFFTGNIVNYNNGKYQIAATGPRGLDGLTVTKDHFFGSSWTDGKVVQIDRKTKETKVLLEGLQTAADFFYDAKNKQLVVPDMMDGKLIFVPIE
jgi:sugar lactone lactonase YvrE